MDVSAWSLKDLKPKSNAEIGTYDFLRQLLILWAYLTAIAVAKEPCMSSRELKEWS